MRRDLTTEAGILARDTEGDRIQQDRQESGYYDELSWLETVTNLIREAKDETKARFDAWEYDDDRR